ncbi:MAG: STAS domain-containing protein [bacterium]|nr:STAS domain-containing protein [bacterium]
MTLEIRMELHGDNAVMHLIGRGTTESCDLLEEAWNEVLTHDPAVIGINCRELEFMNSATIGLFVSFNRVSNQKSKKLIFYNISGNIHEVFEKTFLYGFLRTKTGQEFREEYLTPVVSGAELV